MKIYTEELTYTNGNPRFHLTFYRPGLIDRDFDKDDFAFGPLARIDHAHIRQEVLVPMHEHINDEIFSYIHKGKMLHEDSVGNVEVVTPEHRMLMGAGKSFFHQESTPEGQVEMLQVFIRPEEADLEPLVQFSSDEKVELEEWNHLVGPNGSGAPLVLRQDVQILDKHLTENQDFNLPSLEGYTPWLYVMEGSIAINGKEISKGQAVTLEEGDEFVGKSLEKTTLVLFLVNLGAPMTYAGNFSGQKR
ncbi:pirin family protein [Streptococcus sciuri]|uniref:Pirin family protein n=1 Tax=Streptococcus sciuri TaxID=2973939 RepID=A0ABT2F5S3_9STRE|nr:pirin family protein [Streptococcus sciuri]MCS4487762.1 pirin family protein [Streptococcus sciuri]